MRRLGTAVVIVSLFTAAAAVDALAQTRPGGSGQGGQQETQRDRSAADRDAGNISKGLRPGTVKASDLIGKNVQNRNNQNVGEIQDLLIDRNANRVAYVIFDPADNLFREQPAAAGTRPGAPGAAPPRTDAAAPRAEADTYRDRYLAMPLNQFSVSEGKLVAGFDGDKIRKAPSFQKDQWPDEAGWFSDVDKFYASVPSQGSQGSSQGRQTGAQAGQAGKGEKFIRASQFIKMDVRNPQNDRLGDIQDLVVDMSSGRVLYAVMGAGGFLGLGEKLFAIPVNAFSYSTDDKELVLQADKERLQRAEGFDKGSWPATASRDWSAPESGSSRGSQTGGQGAPEPQRQPQGQSGRSGS
jgi:sporulation protein YlmC with PRC-barrel domain